MSNVKLVRLASNEELICEFKSKDGKVIITNPILIVPTESEKIQLAPWMPYTKKGAEFVIDEEKVFFVVDPDDALINQHREVFSSIIVPKTNLQ